MWRKRRREERGVAAGKRQARHSAGTTDDDRHICSPRTRRVDARAEMANSGRLVAVELAGTASNGRLAVVLARGRRVEVFEGFDAATLERLLGVLDRV